MIQKPLIRDYYLSNMIITEYNQALEYHLEFRQSNINMSIDFIPLSWIMCVVVHDRTISKNVIISFDVKNLTINTNVIVNTNGSNIFTNTGNLLDPNQILGGVNFTVPVMDTSNSSSTMIDPSVGIIVDPYVVVNVSGNVPVTNTNVTISVNDTTVVVVDPIVIGEVTHTNTTTTTPISNTTITNNTTTNTTNTTTTTPSS